MSNSLDKALRERALQVVPGGMWGHMNAKNLPDGYPQFFARSQGTTLWDVDGNEISISCAAGGPRSLAITMRKSTRLRSRNCDRATS